MAHESADAAPFLIQVREQIPDRGRPVLDLACGSGRNATALAAEGRWTVGLDRDAAALATARRRAARHRFDPVLSDLESENAIPLESGCCDAILVFRFLFRALSDEIVRVLAPGGLLVYETFTTGQLALGSGPRNRAFLLEPGELAGLFPGLETLRVEEGIWEQPRPQATARLLARKPA